MRMRIPPIVGVLALSRVISLRSLWSKSGLSRILKRTSERIMAGPNHQTTKKLSRMAQAARKSTLWCA